MSGLTTWFGWSSSTERGSDLPDLFPLGLAEDVFVKTDVINIYTKILTDVIERTQGIPDNFEVSIWDNCLQSEASEGLVTLLAKAMADKKDLFLVFDKSVKVLRKATIEEERQIREDYKKGASSPTGAFVSFKNYSRTDMLILYSALEYCTIAGLNKSMNLSKAIQFKVSELRSSVSLADSSAASAQGLTIATALKNGKDVLLDAKDSVATASPDLTATQASMGFLNQKRSFYLGMPASYITGEAPKGLGDSGEGDAKAVERGLKNYFFSIVKPVVEAVFGSKTTFKSEDFVQLSTSLEAMKTFELTSDELISQDNKRIIINKLFGLPEDTKGDPPAKPDPANAPLLPDPGKKGSPAVPPPAKE
jgi:hypothetical protein